MPAYFSSASTLSLMLFTAVGYALATVGMKYATHGPGFFAVALIAAGLISAVLAEVALLRNGNLSLIYMGIMVAETVLVLTYAIWIDQGLNLRQIGGAALIMSGIIVITSQH